MTVLEVHQVSKFYGSQEVLSDLSLKVEKGDKVGLVGENGCGKTTLLKLIAGLERPTSGAIVVAQGIRIGYLAQHLSFAPGHTVAQEIASVFEEVHQMQAQMRALEKQMGDAEGAALEEAMRRYGRLQEAFDRAEGYACQARVDAAMEGLGIRAWADKDVAVLSGGEKNLVGLAKVLIGEPELLLLDEPGNHLDFAGLSYLEGFLREYAQTVVVVSHDRYLLDRTVNRIAEIQDGKAMVYPGNYSAFRAEKLRALIKQKAAFDDQQKEIRRMEEMIKRFELWGGEKNFRRAHSRQKGLDRMEKIDRPVLDRRRIDPSFVPGQGSGKIALELRGYHREVGGRTLFEQVDFLLQSGQRAGLLGANGTGKSTLFKDVVAHAAWDHPVMRIGPRIRLGYYAQEHETLNPAHTILETVCRVGNLNRDQGFAALSKFLFGWNDLDKKVGDLSGGEKSRVQLAKLMVSGANLLLLDEPTNHLDIASREEVEAALEAFEGTLLVISHDRYFLDKIAECIVEVKDLGLVVHAGNFSDFWAQQQAGKHEEMAEDVAGRIEALEAEKVRLEQAMGAAFEARQFKRGEQCSRRLRQVAQQIEALYEAL